MADYLDDGLYPLGSRILSAATKLWLRYNFSVLNRNYDVMNEKQEGTKNKNDDILLSSKDEWVTKDGGLGDEIPGTLLIVCAGFGCYFYLVSIYREVWCPVVTPGQRFACSSSSGINNIKLERWKRKVSQGKEWRRWKYKEDDNILNKVKKWRKFTTIERAGHHIISMSIFNRILFRFVEICITIVILDNDSNFRFFLHLPFYPARHLDEHLHLVPPTVERVSP